MIVADENTVKNLPWSVFGTESPVTSATVASATSPESVLPTASPGAMGAKNRVITVPAGERCKSFDALHSLLSIFQEAQLTRRDQVIAFGGGAVTDLVAFAASVYLRGIDVILVPTSLLGMVDAAIGGKTGIDLHGYKNMVGTFFPAREVWIVSATLRTLSDREYRSGLAEVIKAAFLGDSALLETLETERTAIQARDLTVMTPIIERAVQVKVGVVSRDFQELGERAFLNLGHTFGHALESVLGLGEWTHGEAVAWGIARAIIAGVALGETDREWGERVLTLLDDYGYSTGPAPADPEAIVSAMYHDKKRTSQGLQFVLQRGSQDTFVQRLDENFVRDILVRTIEEVR